jgi:peroxiredoxin
MNIIKILLTTLILIGLVLAFELSTHYKSETSIPNHAAVGMDVPEFTLYNDEATPIFKISDKKGKTIFIHFWATWCNDCVKEMTSIEEIYKKKATSKDFEMITIIYNDTPSKVKAFMEKNGFTVPVYWDKGGEAAKIFGLTGVPETYWIDKKGILRNKFMGPKNWADEPIIKLIDELINRK